MKSALIILAVFFGILVLGVAGKLLFFGKTIVHNTIDTPREINNRVMNADNAIYNYEWFKQQEADIKRLYLQETNHKLALESYKETLPENTAQWDMFMRDEYSRLSSNYRAQTDMVNRAIANYNAKSSMVTKSIFKDNLPSNLSRSWYAQKHLVFQ